MISTNFMTALRNSHTLHIPGLFLPDCHIAPANNEQDKLLQAQPSPHPEGLCLKPAFPNNTNLSFILNSLCHLPMLTSFSYTGACTGSVGKGRKAFATHLRLFCLLEDSLKSIERIALLLSTFNNLC